MSVAYKKKTTMRDIADKLGISKNAVSLALNNKPGVSDKLRRQIINLASDLDYRGISANTDERGKCIIVVTSTRIRSNNFFYSDIFWSIEQEAKNVGATLITVSVSEESEQNFEIPTFPSEFNIIGLLIIGALSEEYIQVLSKVEINIVSLDVLYKNISISSVCSSNISGAYTAVKYLVENGHKDIGFVGNIYSVQNIYERWCGFNQAMIDNNLEVTETYNICGDKNSYPVNKFYEPHDLDTYLRKITKYPTAWFCGSDRTAISLINALSKLGIRVPEDVSVMGFDDIEFSKMCNPALTTIKIDRKKMGRFAVELLMNLQSIIGTHEVYNVMVPGKLVVRDSVKTIK